ncbi:MAG: class I SAM-dependent methyltransferase [Oscillospiraceae bacterium]
MISLDNRLKTAAALCRSGGVICDVGTDHALLACYLAKNGAKEVLASDINDGPLESARRTVQQYGCNNVRVIKSDGLKQIDYADDVIICGMGGELIADIMLGCRFLSGNTRFILQPMTKAEVLRRRLYAQGFEILEEHTAYDGERAYVIMLAAYTGECRETDEVFALVGKVSDPKYLRLAARKLMKNAAHMDKSESFAAQAARLRETADAIIRKADELS